MTIPVSALWIGPHLGSIERACLKSLVRTGHSVTLYTYDAVAGIPAHVQRGDAAEIIPRERIFRHAASNSYAVFSDWFRYRLQALGRGTWVDCDAYMVGQLDKDRPYLMGLDRPGGYIQNGVLRLPPDSPILPPLLQLFEAPYIPPWLPVRSWIKATMARLLKHPMGPATLPWGATGPLALTYLAKRHGVYAQALQPSVVYPTHWQDADWILDPAKQLEDMLLPDSVSMHLYNEMIKTYKDAPAPEGSFLARLQREGAGDD